MKRPAIVLLTTALIIAASTTTWAACTQEPTEPSIFCVAPDVPVAGQITQFELTELLSPSTIQWDFGDGNKVSTLASRFVEHTFSEPGRYTVKAWVSHPGGFEGITQIVTVAPRDPIFIPTPITAFDHNRNRRIDNDEFFEALDLWIANRLKDLTFFKLMDAWISQSLIVEGSSLARPSQSSVSSYAIYQLDGRLVAQLDCSAISSLKSQQRLAGALSSGIYLVVRADCETGAITRSLQHIN